MKPDWKASTNHPRPLSKRATPSAAMAHLTMVYPSLAPFFEAVGTVRRIRPRRAHVAEAVVRIVVGQMLSRRAAQTISHRLARVASLQDQPVWPLDRQDMRACGLSARKARAISAFADAYQTSPNRYERWRDLDYQSLVEAVDQHWGMSDWTAAMLAIFYFGRADVWPTTDGSVLRATSLISDKLLAGAPLQSDLASPFRSYLAMYLWKSLDTGYWSR